MLFDVKLSGVWRQIDTPADISLQFVKTNMLLAFDTIECERSASFTIPATPLNCSLFDYGNSVQLASLPYATTHTLTARMRGNSVVKEGYLYVNRCSEAQFECVFVFGDLLALKAVKELGNISDILSLSDVADYGEGKAVAANTTNDTLWVAADYNRDISGYPYPSLSLPLLVRRLRSAGVPVERLNIKPWRVVPESVAVLHTTTMQMLGYDNPSEGGGSVGTMSMTEYADKFMSVTQQNARLGGVMNTKTSEFLYSLYGDYQQLMTKEDITITFPDTLPSTVCLVTHMSFDGGLPTLQFLGDYTYTPPRGSIRGGFYGKPLAGRTIEVARNTAFLLYDFATGYAEEMSGDNYIAYYAFANATVTASVDITFKSSATGKVPVQPYIPQITVVELFKAIASLQGDFVMFSDRLSIKTAASVAGKLTFRNIDSIVIYVSEIERTVGDLAQSNYIGYDSSETIAESKRQRLTYRIPNELLDAEKQLAQLPWSEGVSGGGNLYINYEDKPTIASIDASKTKLQATEIARNEVIDRLVMNATRVKLRIRMPLYQFDNLDYTDGFLLHGRRWMWYSGTWSDDTAEIVLQLYD